MKDEPGPPISAEVAADDLGLAGVLAHVRVIVTRPVGQSDALAQLLEARGAQVLLFPTLKIEALSSSTLNKVVHDLDLYHHLIFTSRNAVDLSMPVLESFWPQWPVKQAWYAIGNATAAALRKYGVVPIVPQRSHNSEGLLRLGSLKNIEGKRVCLFKGEAGRQLLQDTLVQRGAVLEEVICYRREKVEKTPSEQAQLAQFLRSRETTFLIASSNETLDNFVALTSKGPASLANCVVVAASDRIAHHAKTCGLRRIAVSKGIGDKSLLEAIQEWCDNPLSSD